VNEFLNWLAKHNVIHDYAIDEEEGTIAVCLHEGGNFYQFPFEVVVVPETLLTAIDNIAREQLDHERRWMAEGLRRIYGKRDD